MTQESFTPSDLSIQIRASTHDIAYSLAHDWYDNHPFKTAFFNALSMVFPVGERSFIQCVTHFSGRLTDPKLKSEVRQFCAQEGQHRRAHILYNETLCRLRGYNKNFLEGRLEKRAKKYQQKLSPIKQLAVTAALEHTSAIFAERLFEICDDVTIDKPMKDLWLWHTAEELEHKSVAFDVYMAVTKGHKKTEQLRTSILYISAFILLLDIIVGITHMLYKNKKLFSVTVWWEGIRFLIGKRGILRTLNAGLKDYQREGFHPWQRDTRPLLDAWKKSQANKTCSQNRTCAQHSKTPVT